jgi:hypothetical protein
MVSAQHFVQALLELAEHLPNHQELNDYLRYAWTHILIPTTILLILLGIAFWCWSRVYRHWYPPTAMQWHRYVNDTKAKLLSTYSECKKRVWGKCTSLDRTDVDVSQKDSFSLVLMMVSFFFHSRVLGQPTNLVLKYSE